MEPLVGLDEACRLFGIKDRTARAWAAAGLFPVVRLSRRCIRVRISDLKRFVDSRTTK
jgi:excisionase family DNA binding protein